MQLTQLQVEVIDTAHSQGHVEPVTFARLLNHDPADVDAAISDLVNRELLTPADGDAFRLTDQGEAVHRAGEKAHRDDVVNRIRPWQRP